MSVHMNIFSTEWCKNAYPLHETIVRSVDRLNFTFVELENIGS